MTSRFGNTERDHDIGYSFDDSASMPNRYAARFREPMWGYFALAAVTYFTFMWIAGRWELSKPGIWAVGAAILAVGLRRYCLSVLASRQARHERMAFAENENEKRSSQDEKIAAARASGAFDRIEQ